MPEIIRGTVNTQNELADDQVVDMAQSVAMRDPDKNQFTTMLYSGKLPREKSSAIRSNWLEDQYRPSTVTLSGNIDNAVTTWPITAGEEAYIEVGQLIRILDTGEAALVTAVDTTAHTVDVEARGHGDSSPAAAVSGALVLLIDTAAAEGADIPDALETKLVLNYNNNQILRTSLSVTRTDRQVDHYSGDPVKRARRKRAVEHNSKREHMLFFGARNYNAATQTGTAGGLYEFVSTNKFDANGNLTVSALDEYLMDIFQHGDTEMKVAFVSPALSGLIASWQRDKLALPGPSEKVFGATVNAVYVGAGGFNLPLIYKRQWGQFAGSKYGASMAVVDMSNVAIRELYPTQLLTDRQNPGADKLSEEYIDETTVRIAVEETHGWIYNCS